MIVGVPTEIKRDEYRVGILPVGVEELTRAGHKVLVQAGAGLGSGLADHDYLRHGALMAAGAEEIYGQAEMILKVKEPQPSEIGLMRRGQIVFTYFHFAADRQLTEAVLGAGSIAVAYETLRTDGGRLPLLTPMSEVAGRMASQVGAAYLQRNNGGRGVLLGGVPGVAPGNVAILGGGMVGTNAAKIALGMGAQVTVLDVNHDRLQYLDDVFLGRLQTRTSNEHNVEEAVYSADLVIGAVLIPGGRAPWLVTRAMLSQMQKGAVIVDVAVDQGGCVETSRPTTHSHPIFVIDDVVHYCVANMPGAVPRTSTFALSNQTLPYTMRLAARGLDAIRESKPLQCGLNTHRGQMTYTAVAKEFGLEYIDPLAALG